ncbi:anti-sigma factor [Terrihabitans sp. B22-R8]|uniref:anti-sigma factor n=1 Tax=Terrihabitans sp. B22-R8 TaxID=3425128 RepID=UPI00403C6EA6
MSAHEPHDDFGDGDERLLAAEYVLGLVGGDARALLARRVSAEPAFAAQVAFWEARLGPIAEDVAPQAVPAHVWQRIEAELGRVPVSASTSREQRGLWNSLPFWRGLSLATSSLAAAGLAFGLFATPPAPPPMIAVLNLDNGQSGFMASIDRGTGRMMLMPAIDAAAPAEHTHELWLIPADGTPRSLGTFEARGPIAMTMPHEMMPHAGADAALAISVEPMGGSPTGQPTGPVVAKGAMQAI